MSAIGNTLKEARTKKSISLEEVHSKIKIHPRVLLLLEEGKFDKLPTPLFAKNFLRSYADFLELNGAELIEAYEKEGKEDPEQVLFIKTVDEKQEAKNLNSNILIVVAVVVALIAGFFVLAFASKHLKPVFQKISFRAPQFSGSKTRVVSKSSKSVSAAKKDGEPKRSPEWVRSVEQTNFPLISKKSTLDLRLRALDNVWVRITADGKVLYQGILSKGAAETWSAKDSLELWTGNAANMYLSLNKYVLGSPGKGMVKKMIITREGVRIPTPENR